MKVTIEVVDYGIGINEADKANLFKPYFKTTDDLSRQMNPSTHGLGLYVCEKISKALGGEISVTSQMDQGSTFKFIFQAKRIKQIAPKK